MSIQQPGSAAAVAVRTPGTTTPGESGVPPSEGRGPEAAPVAAAPGRPWVSQFGVLIAFALTIVVFSALKPKVFPTVDNLQSILTLAAPLLILSCGLTVVLVMGDFDLSIGAIVGLGGAAAVVLMAQHGVSWPVAVVVGIALGMAGGLANGLLIAYLGASSFIVTLAMGTVLTGVGFAIDGQKTIFNGVPEGFRKLGQDDLLLGLSAPFWIACGIVVVLYLLLDQTETGRYMYATGSNPEAARLSGVRTRAMRLTGFVIVGACAALAGVLIDATSASSTPNMGSGYLLPAFAAAFLGSAAFRVGQFNIAGTVVGVLFLGEIQTGLLMLQLDSWVVNVVQGGVLIGAVLLSRAGSR